jgi:hypothetical protein
VLAITGFGGVPLNCRVADLLSRRLQGSGRFRKSAIVLKRFACSKSVRFCGKCFVSNVVIFAVPVQRECLGCMK